MTQGKLPKLQVQPLGVEQSRARSSGLIARSGLLSFPVRHLLRVPPHRPWPDLAWGRRRRSRRRRGRGDAAAGGRKITEDKVNGLL